MNDFIAQIDPQLRKHLSTYRHRPLGPRRLSLEQILIEGYEDVSCINEWLKDSLEQTRRRTNTLQKYKHISPPIITEAYYDNG